MAATTSLRNFRLDRRLLGLLAVAAAIVAGEFGLRGWDAHQQLDAELARVRGRVAVLELGSDQVDWGARIRLAEAERAALQARLWRSPSEAQAQARLRDWLSGALRSAAVPRATINLLPLQVAAAASAVGGGALPALRVRASVNFDLAPGALENALVQIEGGGQLARIDSLSVAARNRRVEMTVSVPVLQKPETGR